MRPKLILLDAFGTLIFPIESIVDIYSAEASNLGLNILPEDIRDRFSLAFKRHFRSWQSSEFPKDELKNWEKQWLLNSGSTIKNWQEQNWNRRLANSIQPSNDAIERQKWKALVNEVFPEACSQNIDQKLFDSLWNRFQEPSTWRFDPAIIDLLHWAEQNQCEICVASNFDQRLHKIIGGFTELKRLQRCFVSTEIEIAKPSPVFYETILQAMDRTPSETVMVGDSWCEDVAVPSSMGIRSFWIHPATLENELTLDNLAAVVHKLSR